MCVLKVLISIRVIHLTSQAQTVANLESLFKKTPKLLIVLSPWAEVTTPPFKMCPQKWLIWGGSVCRGMRDSKNYLKYICFWRKFLCHWRLRFPPNIWKPLVPAPQPKPLPHFCAKSKLNCLCTQALIVGTERSSGVGKSCWVCASRWSKPFKRIIWWNNYSSKTVIVKLVTA